MSNSHNSNSEPPKEGAKYIITRNLKNLVDFVLKDMQEFTNTAFSKQKALEQLKYIVIIAEHNISEHLQKILRILAKILHGDIQNNQKTILQIAELIGYTVPISISLPLILNMLQSEEFKQATKVSTNLLLILSKVICHQQTLQPYRLDIFSLIATYTHLFRQSQEGLLSLLTFSQQYLQLIQDVSSSQQTNILFNLLLEVQSIRNLPEKARIQSGNSMSLLSKKCGYVSISELHANEIGAFLDSLIESKGYSKWTKTSKQRFKFDTIIRNCHEALGRFMTPILEILQHCIGHQNDLEVRIDTLVLIQHILSIVELKEALRGCSIQILKNVLIPSIQWKVGKPQIKIRKAGVINIIHMIKEGIIDAQGFLSCFKDLLPPLKNCLTDQWAPELRLASCELVQQFLQLCISTISDDDLRELYVSLIERLDDAQDPIRKKITLALNVFFRCANLKKITTIFEYAMQGVFVHFDDSNDEIRDAIFRTLQYAATFDAKRVLDQAKKYHVRMKNTQKCQELMEYCQERLQ